MLIQIASIQLPCSFFHSAQSFAKFSINSPKVQINLRTKHASPASILTLAALSLGPRSLSWGEGHQHLAPAITKPPCTPMHPVPESNLPLSCSDHHKDLSAFPIKKGACNTLSTQIQERAPSSWCCTEQHLNVNLHWFALAAPPSHGLFLCFLLQAFCFPWMCLDV